MDEYSPNDDGFEKRLSTLEGQITSQKDKEHETIQNKGEQSSFSMAFRVGSDMIAGIVVGVGIGYALDKWLGYRGLFLVIFALLGFGAGMRNVWRVAAAPVQDLQDKKNGRSPRGERIKD